jgi:hypothetical protein
MISIKQKELTHKVGNKTTQKKVKRIVTGQKTFDFDKISEVDKKDFHLISNFFEKKGTKKASPLPLHLEEKEKGGKQNV